MKVHDKWLVGFAVLALVMSACSGGSETAASVTPAPIDEPTTVPVETPEEEPTSAVAAASDDDLIAAAVSQLEADVAADPGPLDVAGIAAYDLIDTQIDDDGDVTMTICAWNGDTIFDQVRDSIYRTSISDEGAIAATHIATPLAPGDCLNSTLVETAFEVAQQFDDFAQDFRSDPASFATDQRAQSLMTDAYFQFAAPTIAEWVEEGTYDPYPQVPGPIKDTLVEDLLWRRLTTSAATQLSSLWCVDPWTPVVASIATGCLSMMAARKTHLASTPSTHSS